VKTQTYLFYFLKNKRVKENMRMGMISPAMGELLFTELIEIFAEDSTVDLEMLREDMGSVGKDWANIANANRYERELDEKYGVWKSFFLHPFVQRALGVWQGFWVDFHLIGEPRLSVTASVILLFMMYRNKQPLHIIALAACMFFNVHPLAILGVVGIFLLLSNRRYKPRGYRPHVPVEDETGEPFSIKDPFTESKVPEAVDHIIIGSNLSGLYAAGLLSRLGHTCLVLESESTMCGGHLLDFKSNNGETIWEFEGLSAVTGHPLKMIGQLTAAMGVHNCPEFVPVGSVEDGYAYDMVTIGDGGLPIVYRAGRDGMVEELVHLFPNDRKLIESFYDQMAAMATNSTAFFLSRAIQLKKMNYSSSLIGGNFSAFTASSIRAILGQMNVGSQLFSVFASFFREEKLDCDKTSFGAFVSSFNSKIDGAWYPKGGLKAVVQGFSNCIRGTKGRILTDAKVERILVEDNKASGVVVKGNITVKAKCSVISCEGVLTTYKELIPKDVCDSFVGGLPAGISNLQEAPSLLNVFIGLRGSASELGVPACDFWHVPNPDDEVEGQDWFRISFPSAKDPEWQTRYPDKTVCVITLEAEDACRKIEQDGSIMYESVRDSFILKKSLEKRVAFAMKKLKENFPETEGKDEYTTNSKPFKAGLSHTVERYIAAGLRTETPITGLYIGSSDLTSNTFEGAIQGGWLAAHSVMKYSLIDLFFKHRTIPGDLANVE